MAPLPAMERSPVWELTRTRYPDGVDGISFFEKNAPRGTPDWVRTVTLPTPGSSTGRDEADFVVADDVATVVSSANRSRSRVQVPVMRE